MDLAIEPTRRFGAFLGRRCTRVAIGMGLLEISFATVPPIVRGADRRGAATLLPRLRVTPPRRIGTDTGKSAPCRHMGGCLGGCLSFALRGRNSLANSKRSGINSAQRA